jgi:hypothetical protein
MAAAQMAAAAQPPSAQMVAAEVAGELLAAGASYDAQKKQLPQRIARVFIRP